MMLQPSKYTIKRKQENLIFPEIDGEYDIQFPINFLPFVSFQRNLFSWKVNATLINHSSHTLTHCFYYFREKCLFHNLREIFQTLAKPSSHTFSETKGAGIVLIVHHAPLSILSIA